MKSQRPLRSLIAGGELVASLASPGFAGSLPQEPSEEHLLDEDVNGADRGIPALLLGLPR